MKSERFFEVLGDTDEALLAESERPKIKKRQFNMRIATIAACLLLSFSLLLNVLMYALGGASMMRQDTVYPNDDYYAEKENADGGWDSPSSNGDHDISTDVNTQWEQKIVRNARLEGETKHYAESVTALREAIAAAGGYVSDSTERIKSDNARYLTMTIRLPAEKLDAFLSGMGESVVLTSQNVTSSNVTLQYYDAASRLETLRAERTALSAMLEKAETTADILTIQKQLYDVIEEIESLETKLRVLEDEVSYATVSLTLREVTVYTPAEEKSFGEEAKLAFTESWQNFAEFWASFAIGMVSALPALLVLSVLAVTVILTFRAVRKNKKRPHSPASTGIEEQK